MYNYKNLGGNTDNIKIEINYSLRSHILSPKKIRLVSNYFQNEFLINCLDPIELFGSKITALLNRGAARDLYDTYNMIKFKLFDENEETF